MNDKSEFELKLAEVTAQLAAILQKNKEFPIDPLSYNADYILKENKLFGECNKHLDLAEQLTAESRKLNNNGKKQILDQRI